MKVQVKSEFQKSGKSLMIQLNADEKLTAREIIKALAKLIALDADQPQEFELV